MSGHVVLVVDDEPAMRETLAEYLTLHGMTCEPLADGRSLRARVATGDPFDAVLLDVTMPGEDGLSLARWLREATSAGIVMVTARGEALDRIVGLEIGADDYMAKPVDLRELLARLRSVLRRLSEKGGAQHAKEARTHDIGTFEGLTIDRSGRRVTLDDGREVALTSMEFDLLSIMAERAGRVLSRETLLELTHSDPAQTFDRSIDIRVTRLRQKIERDPGRPQIIKTVRGAGYVFAAKRAGNI
jgi:two-component system phosphate regulon response regulator OmpR